jgi:4,5-dihydroxyphthalate decarboxylase
MGKRVGLQSYQTTLAVLAKADLHHEYGVPLEEVIWVTSSDEPIPFELPLGVTVERTKNGEDIQEMLVTGEVEALFSSRVPRPFIAGLPQVAHLFPDPSAEEKMYYRRNGFYPIMHTIVIRNEAIFTNPWIAMSLFEAFERAKQIAIGYYNDPNWTHLAWTSKLVLEQKKALGEDAWANGLSQNRENLDKFVQFEVEQGLIPKILEVESLFTQLV